MADGVGLLLADTSVYHRAGLPDVSHLWREGLIADRIAVTPPVRLEVLYSAQSAADYERTAMRLNALRQVPCGQDAMERALEVQHRLARKHALHHRRVSLPDLLIAAAAELAGVTVWHYDSDYDRIAEVTGQPTEWIVPRGSI